MKNAVLTSLAIIAVFAASCHKEEDPDPNPNTQIVDHTPPVITITGGNSQTQMAPQFAGNGTWTNPPATAIDNVDGDISANISISGNVDPNTVGFDTLYYSVADAAGNHDTDTLVVEITPYTFVHVAPYLEGLYQGNDTCAISGSYTYNSYWTCDNSINDRVSINNFGAFGTAINILCTVNASAQTLSFVTPAALAGPGSLTAASGSYTYSGNNVQVLMNWTWTDGTNSESCVSHCLK
jgi:hypothetical protein